MRLAVIGGASAAGRPVRMRCVPSAGPPANILISLREAAASLSRRGAMGYLGPMSKLVHPVIMSGGAGTRLWPASRAANPKQFHALVGERTLLAQALERLSGEGLFGPALVVCNQAHAEAVRAQAAPGT